MVLKRVAVKSLEFVRVKNLRFMVRNSVRVTNRARVRVRICVTPTPGPVSPIGYSVGISGPPGGVTGAAPVLSETGCLGFRI